ncbi:PilZ domain-containing protein [Candidatus Hydrogenedentota bacterium]
MPSSQDSRTVTVTAPAARMLEIGLSLFLTSSPSGASKVKQEMTIYGWREGHFLLACMQEGTTLGNKFFEGSKWEARYILDGLAHGFRTELTRILRSPCLMLFFKYPCEIEAVSIRKHSRLKTYLVGDAYLGTVSTGAPMSIVVCDLSCGGTLIRADEEMSKGDLVQLSFTLPDGQKIVRIRSEVRNCRKEASRFLIGVGFCPTGNPEISKLLTFFESYGD